MKNKTIILKLAAITLLFALSTTSYAHPKNNSIGLLIGATSTSEGNDFTYGLEYARKVCKEISIKGIVEHTPNGDHGKGDLVGAMLFTVHPWKGFYAGMGPGFKDYFGNKTKALGRLEFGYLFETIHNFDIMPDISLDYIQGNHFDQVYAIIIAKPF